MHSLSPILTFYRYLHAAMRPFSLVSQIFQLRSLQKQFICFLSSHFHSENVFLVVCVCVYVALRNDGKLILVMISRAAKQRMFCINQLPTQTRNENKKKVRIRTAFVFKENKCWLSHRCHRKRMTNSVYSFIKIFKTDFSTRHHAAYGVKFRRVGYSFSR